MSGSLVDWRIWIYDYVPRVDGFIISMYLQLATRRRPLSLQYESDDPREYSCLQRSLCGWFTLAFSLVLY